MPSKYFSGTIERLEPLVVRAWRKLKAERPDCAQVTVELSREYDVLLQQPSTILVQFEDHTGASLHQEKAIWGSAFERWLIDEERARSQSVESEIMRMELLLSAAFQPIRNDVGPHYFDSVLVKEASEGPYADHPAVLRVLQSVNVYAPGRTNLQSTQSSIVAALQQVAARLRTLYPDDLDKADDILARALAAFLDERFSVTSRRLLGIGGRV